MQRAYSVISPLVLRRPDSFEYHYTLAQVSLKMGRWEEALSRLRHCMKLSSNSAKAFTMVGIAMNLNGDHQRAQWFLRRAIGLDPKDKRALLWIIDYKLKNVEEAAAVEYTSKFIDGMSIEQIEFWINLSLDEGFMSQDSKEHLFSLDLVTGTCTTIRNAEELAQLITFQFDVSRMKWLATIVQIAPRA